MEGYKERMKQEYKEVKARYEKLHNLLVRFDSETLDFELNCPIALLRKQASVMGEYLYILEMRGCIEGVDVRNEEVTVDEDTRNEGMH